MKDVAHRGKNEGGKNKTLRLERKLRQDNVTGTRVVIAREISRDENTLLYFEKVVFGEKEAARLNNVLKDTPLTRRNGSLFIRTALKIEEQ